MRPPPLPRRPRPRSAGAVLCAALLGGTTLTACAGPPSADRDLDAATATVLADAADRIGDALDAGDDCAALAAADDLEQRARAAGEAGDAPDGVLTETIRVAAALTGDLRCAPGGDTPDGDGPP